MPSNVIIYDNHPIILYGLKQMLANMDYTLICCTSEPGEFIYQVESHIPEVIILDPVNLPEESFQKLCRIKRLNPRIKIFVLAASDSAWHLIRGHRLEIQGYLTKSDELERIVILLERMKGDKPVFVRSPLQAGSTDQDLQLILSFTNRELQILRELASGKSNKVIATELLLSSKTISTYKRSIMTKLRTDKIRDVVDFARRNGF
ncbi:DNA-binding response regulator [Erwinia billingiae]|jgi:DNA-binding NarL/FixJ family response regulator|uniref:response regulator transcription factor n=1 Tax=Erwinia billingiae TaxID=182337 RepID=UPI001247615E|nr:response regulator transcription factor [Erwinia billingiae]QEW32563.1 DNA-binding response regulator [Erwinia billingiae]